MIIFILVPEVYQFYVPYQPAPSYLCVVMETGAMQSLDGSVDSLALP